MSIVNVSTPEKTVDSVLSKASFSNQLRYEYAREDFDITSVANDGGDAQLLINSGSGDVSSQFAIGDNIYFGADSVYVSGVYPVKAVTFSTNTKVTIDLANLGTATGYLNVLTRANHRIEVSIFDSAGAVLLIDKVLSFAGNQAGNIVLNIGKIMTGYLRTNDLQDIFYSFRYREAYTGLTPPALSIENTHQAVNGRKQQLTEGGSNAWKNLLRTVLTFNTPVTVGIYDGLSGGTNQPTFTGGAEQRLAQGFKVTQNVNHIDFTMLNITKSGSPVFVVGAKIMGDTANLPNEADVKSTSPDTFNAGSAGASELFTFTGTFVTSTQYWFVIDYSTVVTHTASDLLSWLDRTISTYADGRSAVKPGAWAGAPPAGTGDFASTFDTKTIATTTSGFFLTKFTNPFKWTGWKRTVTIVLDFEMLARIGTDDPKLSIFDNDINKNALNSAVTTAITETLQLKELTISDGIHANAAFKNVRIVDNLELFALINAIDYEILPECSQPIYIEWLNTLGAYEQHLFNIDQEFNDNIEEGTEFKRALVDDLSTSDRLIGRTEGNLAQVMQVAAENITIDQLHALREIKSSPEVRVYLEKDGSSFIYVSVNGLYDTVYSTRESLHNIFIELKFPDNFNFEEAKQY